MIREQLAAVHDALVEITDGWNDAAADGDRGRASDSIILLLNADGSGALGRFSPPFDYEYLHDFADVDGLIKTLADMGIDLEAPS